MAGLTLNEIGRIWCRTDMEGEEPSIFERIVINARRQADLMHEFHDNQLYYPLSLLKKIPKNLAKKTAHPGFKSVDMDTYDKIRKKDNGKSIDREEVKAIPERRGRANTMLDEVGGAEEEEKVPNGGTGLAIIQEKALEEEKEITNATNVKEIMETILEEEKHPKLSKELSKGSDTPTLPILEKTASIQPRFLVKLLKRSN